MWSLLWPIMTVVAANCLYNVCAKQTPGDVNTFASLSVTYLIASAMSLAAFFLSGARQQPPLKRSGGLRETVSPVD